MANHLYYWDTALWNDGRWACYSALWDTGVWGLSLWDYSWIAVFFNILDNMEKVNIGDYLFLPGVCVPGMDNFKSKASDVIRNLGK